MDAEIRERRLSLSMPLETAGGTLTERTAFVVRLARGGVAGIGEATPLPGWTEPVADCRTALETAVERLQEAEPRAAMDALEDRPAASHGIRLATADRAARVEGDPLYRHLGGPRSVGQVPVNATVGDGSVEETARAAERALAEGFDTLKVKVGARPVGDDLDRMRAVREVVGPDVVLRADANGAWNRSQARDAFETLYDLRVSYVEQPLAADDLEGLRSLRGHGVGVAVDETLQSHDVETVLSAGAADAAILKPMVQGGPRETVRAARRARNGGVDPVITTTVDGVVARTAAVHCAAAVPATLACGLATADRLADDLGEDPAPVAGGTMRVPRGPGIVEERTANGWWA